MADRIVVMDKGPGHVVSQLKVEMPHPRDRKSAAFLVTIDRVYGTLAGQTEPESVELGTAPGEPGRTRALPHVGVNDLAGLLERLDELAGNRADIYRLTEDLKVDSSHLLALIEAAELLGFASVAQGAMTLTTLGETFAEASIIGRKAIFAARLRRVPLFRWLLALLKASHRQQLDRGVVQTALELEFPADEAGRQVDIAIEWGRYGEVLAYDDSQDAFYLETPDAAAQ
jgi:NitT/TauT family transport system ATP-binding protein